MVFRTELGLAVAGETLANTRVSTDRQRIFNTDIDEIIVIRTESEVRYDRDDEDTEGDGESIFG